VNSADEIFGKVVAVLDEKLGKDSEDGATEASEWRTPAVVDIENRFYSIVKDQPYGSLKDQPEAQAA
jgi:hypothetical protein